MAASAAAGEYRAPRTASGAPDLSGLWSNNSLTQLERPDDFKSLVVSEQEARTFEQKHRGQPPEIPNDVVGGANSEWWETDTGLARIRGQARSSWIVSPADGQLPFTAQAKAANKARRERRKTDFDNPESRDRGERCLAAEAAGPPMLNGGYDDNFMLVQTTDSVAILAEYMHDVRIVRLGDAVHPPASVRRLMGDSIGHWEGDTLVIETTNFTRAEVGDDAPPGADMTVIERLTRISPTELFYEFQVHDPAEFIQPWRGEMVLRATKGPIYEYACHEGNYALPSILSAGRQADAAKVAAVGK